MQIEFNRRAEKTNPLNVVERARERERGEGESGKPAALSLTL